MRSYLTVKYNNADATSVITDDCEGFTWTDYADGQADTVELTLNNQTHKWLKGYFPDEKDSVKVWLHVEDWQVGSKKKAKVYCGKFAVDNISFTGFPETVTLSGISLPVNNNFNVRQRRKTWKETTVQGILSTIAGRADLTLQFDADDSEVESMSQSGQTDLSFAYSLCSEYDLALKVYNGKMIVYDKLKYEKKASKHTIKRSGLCGSYTVTKQITEKYNSVKAQYTKNEDTLTYVFDRPDTKGNRQMFLTSKAESLSDAKKKAKAALRENIRQTVTVTLDVAGNVKYLAAQCVTLEDFGKLDGKYFVDSAVHERTSGKYTTSLTMHQCVTDF